MLRKWYGVGLQLRLRQDGVEMGEDLPRSVEMAVENGGENWIVENAWK